MKTYFYKKTTKMKFVKMRMKIDKMLAHVCLLLFKSVFFFLKSNKIKENTNNIFGSHFYFVPKKQEEHNKY